MTFITNIANILAKYWKVFLLQGIGYTLLLSAAVLSGGLALLLGSGFGAAAASMGRWLAVTALLCLAYFGLAALCAMLTGHWLMLPALFVTCRLTVWLVVESLTARLSPEVIMI